MNLTKLGYVVSEKNIERIKNLNILVIGLGGVGGYAVESLVRSGIEKITLVDGDTVKENSFNRQLIANNHTLNKYKTKEFKKRIKSINKNTKVTIINTFIDDANAYLLFGEDYDYIIDTTDNANVKYLVMKECLWRNLKLITCMDTNNRVDATKLVITTLYNAVNDPYAKRMKKSLSEEDQSKIIVITSNEAINKTIEQGNTSYVPGIAGLLITNYIINQTIK